MRFLCDLKLVNDTWYKKYLLSQTNETDPTIFEPVDDELEHEDQHEFISHSMIDEDFDLESFNELFETENSQFDINKQHKQTYL